jgi:hypothetical protein
VGGGFIQLHASLLTALKHFRIARRIYGTTRRNKTRKIIGFY